MRMKKMVNQHTDIIDNKLPRKNDLSGNRKSFYRIKNVPEKDVVL